VRGAPDIKRSAASKTRIPAAKSGPMRSSRASSRSEPTGADASLCCGYSRLKASLPADRPPH
jgi:hypothetical protein